MENFTKWIVDNKETLGIIIPAFATLPVIGAVIKLSYNAVIWLITFVFRLKTDDLTKEAYQKTENAVESQKNNILSEPMFFDEPDKKKYFFYNGLTITNLFNTQKK